VYPTTFDVAPLPPDSLKPTVAPRPGSWLASTATAVSNTEAARQR
jgi:hypothetical protein